MTEIDWSAYDSQAYDDLQDEASRDDRLGNQMFMVTEAQNDKWPSGDAFRRVSGVLTTARNAKADITFTQPVAADVVKSEMAGWDQKKVRAIANSRAMVKNLIEHYGVNPSEVKSGDSFAVRVVKNKAGYIRIVAILSKDAMVKDAQESKAEEVPF